MDRVWTTAGATGKDHLLEAVLILTKVVEKAGPFRDVLEMGIFGRGE